MIVRVDDDAGHEGCANGALPGNLHSQFLPLPSPISRAIDPGRTGAGKRISGSTGSMVSNQIVVNAPLALVRSHRAPPSRLTNKPVSPAARTECASLGWATNACRPIRQSSSLLNRLVAEDAIGRRPRAEVLAFASSIQDLPIVARIRAPVRRGPATRGPGPV
jgi:hypothetical protein